ncbi:carbohydrate binding family 9 domain-containing protein, partial [bacterium]|nr:carbohydrate binding family 9 domain-containing protein [bacterium]
MPDPSTLNTKARILGMACTAIVASICSAAAPSTEVKPVQPPRIAFPPVIDGNLDDTAWESAPLNPHFMTYFPTYGDSLPQKTWVWITYDEKKLYFAFRCEDNEPEKIKTSISQRDNIFSDDWVGVSVDAMGNRQSSVEFFVNPSGIQGDILNSSNQGEDSAPDYVWESAGTLTRGGYQVEIAVPLRTLRFKSGSEVDMNVVFMRRINRMGMSGSWPELKPGDGYLNQHMPVRFRDLSAPLNLEVLPSATYSDRRERRNPDAWARPDRAGDFGIGVKYGLTSSIVTDLTYNPDFSQVESDAFQAEVNRRYPVFYSEKRPFFMEGMDIFDFVIIPQGMMITPVHTRRIVDPGWGAKLSGTSGRTAFGLIASGDDFPGYAWEDEKNPNEGKKARFGVARVRRSLRGENYMGLLYSSRFFDGLSNQVIGADTKLRFENGVQFNGSVMGSATVDSAGAGAKQSLGINTWIYRETRRLELGAGFDRYGKQFAMETAFLRRTGVNHGWIFSCINS